MVSFERNIVLSPIEQRHGGEASTVGSSLVSTNATLCALTKTCLFGRFSHVQAHRVSTPSAGGDGLPRSLRQDQPGKRAAERPYTAGMYIGELARRANVSVQALRLYERSGLLPKPTRSASGYRQFTERHLEILGTIKQLKRFGCTLAETRAVLALYAVPDARTGRARYPSGSHACGRDVLEIGIRKLAALDQRIDRLTETRRELSAALDQLRARLAGPVSLDPAPR